MANAVTKFFGSVFGGAKKFVTEVVFKFYNEHRAEIFSAAVGFAKDVKDTVLSYNLKDPVQREAAIQKILGEAAGIGKSWGAAVLVDGQQVAHDKLSTAFDADLKQYLHLALLTKPLIEKYGVDAIPPDMKFLRRAVEWALGELDEASK